MLQFLRCTTPVPESISCRVISGSAAVKFFGKRALNLLLLIYATFFLAVAIEQVESEIVYFIGGILTFLFLVRTINDGIKFKQYNGGAIAMGPDGIACSTAKETTSIIYDDIKYIEVNLLGNLVIRQKQQNSVFPLTLLSEEDRNKCMSQFTDMAPKRTELFRKVWDFIDAIFIAFILAMHIRQYIIQAYFIPTGSMEDTLQIGDHLLVEKITYGPIIPQMMGMQNKIHLDFLGLRDVRRGDIVIFRPPHEKEKDFIKRCIAIEGDRFTIKNGSVFINDKEIKEDYIKGITSYIGFGSKKIEGKVPPGHIIVLGDNRQNSYDSRGFGYLEKNRIKGKALVLYWNTKQIFEFDFSRLGLIR